MEKGKFCIVCKKEIGLSPVAKNFCSRGCLNRYNRITSYDCAHKKRNKGFTEKEIKILFDNTLFAEEKAKELNLSYKSILYHFYNQKRKRGLTNVTLSYMLASNRDYRYTEDYKKKSNGVTSIEDYKAKKILEKIKKGKM